jgi:hypothetical protein
MNKFNISNRPNVNIIGPYKQVWHIGNWQVRKAKYCAIGVKHTRLKTSKGKKF